MPSHTSPKSEGAMMAESGTLVNQTFTHDEEQPRAGNMCPSLGRHLRTLAACVSASVGSMALGSVIGYTSPAVPDLNAPDRGSPFRLNEMEISWVASIISIGGLAGVPIAGVLLDRFGRKAVLMMASIPCAVGWLVIASSSGVPALCVGRFVTGLCCGVIDIAVPIYITEVSPTEVRGFMGSCHELATNVGFLFVFAAGCVLRWNWLAVACSFVPIALLLFVLPMPESPRWLLAKGRRQESRDVLRWLRGPTANIASEIADMEQNIQLSGSSLKLQELRKPAVYKHMAIIGGLMFFQQFSGYGVIPEYMVHIIESSGNRWDPYLQTAIVGAFGVLANFVSALVVDRSGRRVMLVISAAIMVLGMFGLGSFFTLKHLSYDLTFQGWIPTLCLVSYNFGVALGYGPIPFYLSSELFPLRARGLAGGISISMVWLFMFITALGFPHMILAVHDFGVYWIMTGFAILGILFVLFAVPETKGRSLEEIERHFED